MQQRVKTRQSYAQQRLWFLSQIDPEKAQHNILIRTDLNGPLQSQALEQSFGFLLARHAVLRTRYENGPNGPVQWVDEQTEAKLNRVDLTNLDASAQRVEAERIANEERERVFDLRTGPVIAAYLLSYSHLRHELIINVHHIAFDGRSGEILFAELAEGYDAALIGKTPAPLPWQYTDFAEREPELLPAKLREKQLAFWRDYLQAVPLNLKWSGRTSVGHADVGRTSSLNGSAPAGRCCFMMPSDVLEQFASEHRQSVFQTLLTLFSVWIHHLGQQECFLVGTDIHGRTQPEVDALIGFFVNQLALKCDLTGDPTLTELFARTRRNTRQAYGHHRLPFDVLVAALAPQRELSRAPLFQVKLNYQPYRVNTRAIGEAVLSPVRVEQDLAGFDLVLDLTHASTGIEACLEYNGQLFSKQEIDSALELWQHLNRELPRLMQTSLSEINAALNHRQAALQQNQQQAQNNRNRARLQSISRRTRIGSA